MVGKIMAIKQKSRFIGENKQRNKLMWRAFDYGMTASLLRDQNGPIEFIHHLEKQQEKYKRKLVFLENELLADGWSYDP
jgi:hypothetical protein